MKVFKFLGLAVVAVMMMGAMNSCGGDDEPVNPTNEFKSATFAFSYTVSSDLLEVADVNITYIDATGAKTTEKMTTTTWTKNITATTLPVQAGYKVSITRNSNALTKDVYSMTQSYSNKKGYMTTSSSSMTSFAGSSTSSTSSVGKDYVDDYIGLWAGRNTSCGYKIYNDNGTIKCDDVTLTF